MVTMQVEKIITLTKPINIEIEYATLLPEEIYQKSKDIIPRTHTWWIKSNSLVKRRMAKAIDQNGNIHYRYASCNLGLRVALKIISSDVRRGDKLNFVGSWTVLDDGFILYDYVHLYFPYNSNTNLNHNNYKNSEIAQSVDWWAFGNDLIE